jgi:tRNA-specific 2-thiouridylase
LYEEKDQSYALWGISQKALKRTLFPLGGKKKPEVRALAERLGLRNAQKQESFEICFVPDNRYDRFLTERVKNLSEEVAGGDIVLGGMVVGKHQGYPFYTIGQRHNIGAFGRKMYVTEIDSRTNTLRIGPDKELFHRSLLAGQINWVGLSGIEGPLHIQAKVRYKDEAAGATIYPAGEDKIRLIFEEPKRAVTPGQSVVFYDHDDVVGGGVIEEAGD